MARRKTKNMEKQNQKIYNPPMLKFVTVLTIAYLVYYLWWRANFTLNPSFPFFSWVLWGAEAFGVFSYILFSWLTKNIAPIVPYKLPYVGMKVDIFIPTYNEDLEILEATLVGCCKIRYPHETYILDDGNRPLVKELATQMGCNYIARPFHDHAKAGNINYALQHTHGEFIVILDADMVPQPEYLDRTLGYFEDEKLALVQLPQEFYNQDSIQHASNTPTWHEQSLFFRVIQPGKNYTNSAFWCGSPSVVRREALEEVGGVATETITEDIHTSVRLHSRGWKTLYINEPLAYGIAPQTIRAFLLQRLRWAQGTMQLYRSKESPLWMPGLSWSQRLSYLSSFLAYFEAFQKFILLTIPVFILTFDVFPMRVGVTSFILHWVPYFLLNFFANQIGGRGVFQYFKTEKYNVLKMIIFIQSTFTLVSKKPLTFKVTPKTVDDTVYKQERQALRVYMVIFGSLVGSIIYSLIKALSPHTHSVTLDAFIIALFWAAYNAYIIFSASTEVFQKKHERKQYRFPVDFEGRIFNGKTYLPYTKVHINDLSITGAGFYVDQKLPNDATDLILRVHPPEFKDIFVPIGKVHYQRSLPSGKILVGASFGHVSGQQRQNLFEYLFLYLPRIDGQALYQINEWHPIEQVQKIFRRTSSGGTHPA
jgi:cellulose synthase (UDP-forming)